MQFSIVLAILVGIAAAAPSNPPIKTQGQFEICGQARALCDADCSFIPNCTPAFINRCICSREPSCGIVVWSSLEKEEFKLGRLWHVSEGNQDQAMVTFVLGSLDIL
ncbi:predicted protein [Plenodomus lingam JN3]|uniref:Predicted protein n=1 Tax=Leptosphaeria maculans (strain JN3 / isolate v23.1.3 / race Av1-4-5-6-7-8) TaxID=985895 RepID=E5A1M5_LEPMJ|nr:predicted protein [Plenodomus lingam JN3]CBX97489.1 predicted protein [Plenodomus lingam JN3]